MPLRVIADLNLCQGYANCVMSDPDRFAINDDGRVDVLEATVSAADEGSARAAVSSCPVRALTLAEDA